MEDIKIYECEICKSLVKNKVAGQKRYKGTRKGVRKHLREVHGIKGRKNQDGLKKQDFGKSFITSKTLSEKMK